MRIFQLKVHTRIYTYTCALADFNTDSVSGSWHTCGHMQLLLLLVVHKLNNPLPLSLPPSLSPSLPPSLSLSLPPSLPPLSLQDDSLLKGRVQLIEVGVNSVLGLEGDLESCVYFIASGRLRVYRLTGDQSKSQVSTYNVQYVQ